MIFHIYIFYSANLDRYYVGHTGSSLDERLKKHLSHHRGFTAKTKDWKIVYTEKYATKSAAYKRELEIKARKSQKYIEQLVHSGG
ncbi:MAG: GIY-YIG nuclease family protein [Salinimicrobium sediminis]|nr:GIY-YIG nuclease family protein [Salinimicrobium sediminis]